MSDLPSPPARVSTVASAAAGQPASASVTSAPAGHPASASVASGSVAAAGPAIEVPDDAGETDPYQEWDTGWSAAERAATDAVLRCWAREAGLTVPPPGGLLVAPLAASSVTVVARVRHRSAVGWHRFGAPYLVAGAVASGDGADAVAAGWEAADFPGGGAPGGGSRTVGQPLDPVTLVALCARESGADSGSLADLTERAAESVRRVAVFLEQRREAKTAADDDFLEAEQALLLGHLIHPAPKSRDGISAAEAAAYSPELRGSFPLHWFAADPSVVAHDTVAGMDVRDLVVDLAQLEPSLRRAASDVSDAAVLVPAHPWQARDLASRPAVRDLIDAGLLRPLGPSGPHWYPTSSLRTVYRPDTGVMLKLSLGLRITNSRRENTKTELVRGAEVHRLLDAGIADEVAAAYPGFRIVRDPAWLAVTTGEGELTHLDVSVREVPPGLSAASCLAGLVAPHPGIGPSMLVATVRRIAARTGRPVAEVAAEWVRRYVDTVLAPMVHLYRTTGIGLEAHQQNTLVIRDADGWPAAGWFRDNQGYYLAESGVPGVLARTGANESSLAVVDDDLANDRLTYYLLFNQALAPVGALGSEGVAAEPDLLAAVRDGLHALIQRGHDSRNGLVRRWLDADALPCKANFATRIAGIDEVLAPLDHQSVYLAVPNPLKEATR